MESFLEKQKRAYDESIFEIIMKEKKGDNLSEVALEAKRTTEKKKFSFDREVFVISLR
jgi:hypothetical protein